ncbi:MAG: tetratricopeptide repeat protein [Lentisphaeria bacterium]|nr:tetratricopeptide repeat protein [Lentisphaeria bacterium]NQZ68452.1 tetratricopeptide repeat protein [Lentisphaeria bacterium]
MKKYLIYLITLIVATQTLTAAREAKGVRKGKDRTDLSVSRLLKSANAFIESGQEEKGLKMLQNIVDNYPKSPLKYNAYLAMGRFYVSDHKEPEGLRALKKIQELKKLGEDLKDEKLEIYLESLYISGIAYFNTRMYTSAFPALRKITKNYPNTVWANQSYYYIGMCHFRMENWTKCIENLALVGTFVDVNSATIKYIEAGQRFYLKVSDTDLPIMRRLGKLVKVEIKTKTGDRETIILVPLNSKGDIYIGSIPTKIGKVEAKSINDKILQVLGGEEISVSYVDGNTFEGAKDVPRSVSTRVVSTGRAGFTLGTWEGIAGAAYLEQPVHISVYDADLDVTDGADKVTVQLISRYKEEQDEDVAESVGVDISKLLQEGIEETWVVRDTVTIELTELDIEKAKTIHSGQFIKKFIITTAKDGEIDKTDKKLECRERDELIIRYVDSLHIGGLFDRTVTSKIIVAGEIDARPKIIQNVVTDPLIKAQKNLVEGEAYYELSTIFRDMGLIKGCKEKGDEAIGRMNKVISLAKLIPEKHLQRAYQIRWETQMVKEEYKEAIATCQEFNKLFPDSPLVDKALVQIALIHMAHKNFGQAQSIFKQILALQESMIKAEAQFRIAECIELAAAEKKNPKGKVSSAAIPAYQRVSEKYPDSKFAGQALKKQIDYYYKTKDYTSADELLETIFDEHPDAKFLDSMLIKWVLVAYKMSNFSKAHEKCSMLLFQYPESPYARKALKILPKLEKKLGINQEKKDEE